MTWFYDFITGTSIVVQIVVSVAIMMIFGFLITRLTKLIKLPNVTGYILAGIIIGPYALNLIPKDVIGGMDFVSDIALAFIAFGIGEYFRFSLLKKNGAKVLVLTLFEILITTILVFVVTYFVLGLGLAFAIILSALASATAPAAIMTIVKKSKAKGEFVDTLLQVVALDDVIGIFAYSIAISLSIVSLNGSGANIDFLAIALPIIKNVVAIGVGILLGFVLKWCMTKKHTNESNLLIIVCTLLLFSGLCAVVDISPLIGCMVMGTVYNNVSKDKQLFKHANAFSPPLLLLFFVKGGLALNFSALFSSVDNFGTLPIWAIGVIYFLVRIVGKFAGAFCGCLATKRPKEVRNYIGLSLLPQASIAIGLATFGARMIGGELGVVLQTIILASSVLNELVGPVLVKVALHLSKSSKDIVEQEDIEQME